MNSERRDLFWPAACGLVVLGVTALLYDLGSTAFTLGRFSGSLKWRLGGLGGLLLLALALAAFVLSWTPVWPRVEARLNKLHSGLRRLSWFNLFFPLVLIAFFLVLVYFPPDVMFDDPQTFSGLYARLGLVALVAAVSAPFMCAAFPRLNPAEGIAIGALAAGFLYKAAGFISAVSPSPFTLGWSEASRFYYGSLFQSTAIYGQSFPWPFLHPTRYLLLSLPFLIQGLPIWVHRLWQVFLWLGTSGLTGWALARRLAPKGAARWMLAGWAFLFLFQGPVYYHLLFCVFPVLLWFDRRHFWRSLIVIILTSAWAGISRINWIPMPVFLALMLYLLETSLRGGWRGLWAYLRAPLAWGVGGGAAALAANALYVVLSRQPDPANFRTSFASDLLFNRLWPSPTYPPGIFPMVVFLSLPLLVLLLINLRAARMHPLRWLALAAMNAVMFLGGLVVSVKIGGGSNLHNMDAYLVLVMTWGAAFWCGEVSGEDGPARLKAPWWLVSLVVALPFVPLLMEGGPVRFEDQRALQAELTQLRADLKQAAGNGPVLFIWQRQLITFDEIQGYSLVYDYETVDLMEMAMANKRSYLETFYAQLAQRRYTVIVAEAQNDVIRGMEDAFPEENNVWVERVTRPLLQYYQPLTTYALTGTQLLVPRP